MRKILTALAVILSLVMLLACGGQPIRVEVTNARDIGGGAPLTRAAGDTNFTNVVASGDLTAGDDVIVGDDLTFTAGGLIDVAGGADAVVLDDDDDTSISAPTDDQIDVELGGADIFVLKDWGTTVVTTDTTENLLEIIDTTNVMTAGTNSLAALNIDLGIGNSTGGTNNIYGILIDGITADAQNTETAISIGAGWDTALDLAGDVTISAESTGGNLGAKSEFIGLPRIKMVAMGAGTNPITQTIAWMDDTPIGEWAPISTTVVEANSTTLVKYGTNAYQTTWSADAVATHGFKDAALGGNASFEDMESVGILVRSDTAWAAGDLTLVLTDDGGAQTFDIPALTATDVWTWLEVNITALDAGTGDVISDVAILMSAQGEAALGAFVAVWDIMYTWDAADEEDLGVEILQDGVLSVVDPADGTNLVELTNYIVHLESGSNTHIVWITDESAAYNLALIAY